MEVNLTSSSTSISNNTLQYGINSSRVYFNPKNIVVSLVEPNIQLKIEHLKILGPGCKLIAEYR